ncbi:hypothetical protein HDU76_000962 [Blyttiomyces sp. JEL0837]|nr:hypothetical protein HDU76_000962 [Blyttiomyces sp. JEL0837]
MHRREKIRKWDVVVQALSSRMENPEDIEAAIKSYSSFRNDMSFAGLTHYLLELTSDAQTIFELIPKMCKLALRLPTLIKEPIPILKAGHNAALTLLANAFFCTFADQNKNRIGTLAFGQQKKLPSINFDRIFAGDSELCPSEHEAKLNCMFEYFQRVTTQRPVGNVTFHRRSIKPSAFPDWNNLDLGICGCRVKVPGCIEDDGRGMSQVDFANKFIGGGVLGWGAVQEEIMFMIIPELIVSRLFVEELQPNEALFMIGAERYSNYSGYASTFTWESPHQDSTPRGDWGRLKSEIIAIDAVNFKKYPDGTQYEEARISKAFYAAIVRELNKAFTGFQHSELSCFDDNVPIATGNWGCGAFGGDAELKSMIQLIAASAACRDILYFTFGNLDLAAKLQRTHSLLQQEGITIVTIMPKVLVLRFWTMSVMSLKASLVYPE